MYSLNVNGEKIYLRDIKLQQMPMILSWYNNIDEFKFATGIDRFISMEELNRKLYEIAINENMFFSGIFGTRDELLGVFKGVMGSKDIDSVWIHLLLIDALHQRKGIGTRAMALLQDYLKALGKFRNMYLLVLEDNVRGRKFWHRNGFDEVNKLTKKNWFNHKMENVVIMGKNII